MAQYLPLHSPRDIRLLRLEPFQESGNLIGTLSVYSVDYLATAYIDEVAPLFRALSYSWGEPEHGYSLQLNGHVCPVRPNLHAFLTREASSSHGQYLWIDALCIDQQNIDERSTQVQMMPEIYKLASTVIVWLGPDGSDGHSLMELVGDESINSWYVGTVNPALKEFVLNWYSNPYWTRTWIIQEVALAKTILFVLGRFRVKGIKIYSLLDGITHPRYGRPLLGRNDDASQARSILRQRVDLYAQTPRLMDVLISNRRSRCSDPRDKVYAMLGVARLYSNGGKFVVDYTESIEDLLCRVLAFCNVLPQDVFRHAFFLRRLLAIKGTHNEAVSPRSLASLGLFSTAWGFKTGKVVEVESTVSLTEPHATEPDPTGTPIASSDLAAAPPTPENSRLLAALLEPICPRDRYIYSHCHASDLSRLAIPPQVLTAVSKRSFYNPSAGANNQQPHPPKILPHTTIPQHPLNPPHTPPAPPTYSLCKISLPGRRPATHLAAGIVSGATQAGDILVQFPGYDIGMTIRVDQSGTPCEITGRAAIMLITNNNGEPPPQGKAWKRQLTPDGSLATDSVTFESLEFDTIQTPSETNSALGSEILLEVRGDELVQLVT